MGGSEREKMAAGAWYRCLDPELERLRAVARAAVHEHNTMPPDLRGAIAPRLKQLLPRLAPTCSSKPRFTVPMASISIWAAGSI